MSAITHGVSDESAWLNATRLEDLRRRKHEILASDVGGTTIDLETICEEMEVAEDDIDEDALLDAWFDRCLLTLGDLFAEGSAIVHRAIEVDDVDAFRAATFAGEHPGCHWSHDPSCASTAYHPGPTRRHTLMLTARVLAHDVCWGTTIQKLFAHPHEREITIFEKVRMLAIDCGETGRPIWRTPEATTASTSGGTPPVGLPS